MHIHIVLSPWPHVVLSRQVAHENVYSKFCFVRCSLFVVVSVPVFELSTNICVCQLSRSQQPLSCYSGGRLTRNVSILLATTVSPTQHTHTHTHTYTLCALMPPTVASSRVPTVIAFDFVAFRSVFNLFAPLILLYIHFYICLTNQIILHLPLQTPLCVRSRPTVDRLPNINRSKKLLWMT